MDKTTGNPMEALSLIAGMWVLSAIVSHKLGPKKLAKAERLCGYHLASVNRRSHLSVLDSARCEICKEEGISNV